MIVWVLGAATCGACVIANPLLLGSHYSQVCTSDALGVRLVIWLEMQV